MEPLMDHFVIHLSDCQDPLQGKFAKIQVYTDPSVRESDSHLGVFFCCSYELQLVMATKAFDYIFE